MPQFENPLVNLQPLVRRSQVLWSYRHNNLHRHVSHDTEIRIRVFLSENSGGGDKKVEVANRAKEMWKALLRNKLITRMHKNLGL